MKLLDRGDPTIIDKYQLLGVLGQGGMGRVYLGRSPDGVIVAVKVISPELAGDPRFVERFRREMRAAEYLGDGYAASLVGCEPDGAPPWLATKFIVGAPLAALVEPPGDAERSKVRPLDAGAVWWLAFGLLKALQEIHSCDIVHRDLKPGNVIIAPGGPKVIDFGIALGVGDSGLAAPHLTLDGARLGTLPFMSPEQLRPGHDIGPASDVFALGTVLVYAATGKVPERYADGGVVRDGSALRMLPPELRPLIQRCLGTRPADRARLSELLHKVVAAKSRYTQAAPSFWPQPMAGRVDAAADAIRRSLPADVARDAGKTRTETAIDDPYAKTRDDGRMRRTRTLRLPLPMDDVLFHVYRPDSAVMTVIRRPGDPLDAAAYFHTAEVLWQSHDFVGAEDAYRAGLRLDKASVSAHVDLGCLLWDRRRYRDAKAAFVDALRQEPDLIAARRNLFIVTKNAGGDDQQSGLLKGELRRYCETVLATEAYTAAGQANRGDALCCLERDDEAVQAYQMALTYDEGNLRLRSKLDYATRRLTGG
jgi:tetratricopeptide (TPR) repeat protein